MFELGVLSRLMASHESPGDLLRTSFKQFVNTFTLECLEQVPAAFQRDPSAEGVLAVSTLDEDVTINREAHEYRLRRLLEWDPRTNVYLLAHEPCLFSDLAEGMRSWIELARIDTGDKAVEWTIHLGEKRHFNATGWARTLALLFGRRSVSG